MNITNERAVMIFKKEYQGNTFYSLGLSKKDKNGNYINGYMPCQFKNGVSIEDKTKIQIKSAWLSFYLKDKETKPYVFINDFDLVEEAAVQIETDPFLEFGQEVNIDDNFLD